MDYAIRRSYLGVLNGGVCRVGPRHRLMGGVVLLVMLLVMVLVLVLVMMVVVMVRRHRRRGRGHRGRDAGAVGVGRRRHRYCNQPNEKLVITCARPKIESALSLIRYIGSALFVWP